MFINYLKRHDLIQKLLYYRYVLLTLFIKIILKYWINDAEVKAGVSVYPLRNE